jgi:ubiquinone/menaquinone biosynthesis C-methylase UbiE
MDKIKAFLEKYPRLDKIVRKIYIPLAMKYIAFRQYLRRNRLGDWWAKRGNGWAEGNWNSRDHPHRSFLVERIAAFSPISSVLEIGCASGPNLYLLAKRFPQSEIRGIEINPQAVEVGSEGFAREGISNVKLSVGRAEDLCEFKDKSFDVVFTDAVLIYIKRSAICYIIKEMLRIARKGLVLVECHDFEQRTNDKRGLGFHTRGLWVRDYVALLKQFVPEEQIRVTKITKEIWPDDGWGEHGALIEVTIA